ERKRTEEALSIQNLLLVTQQETSLDGILVVGKTRDILYSNRRFEEMWKIPPGAIATKSDDLVIKTILDTLENPEEFMKKVSYLYTHHNESSNDNIVLKGGRIFTRYSAPMLSDNAKYFGRVWYFRDITQQKQAEDLLHKRESDFRSLFEATPSGAVMIQDRTFKRVSKRFAMITGYTEEELQDKPTRFVYPDDAINDFVGKELYRTMRSNGLGQCEAQLKRKDGSLIDILIYASPFDPDDLSKGIAATIEDITQKKIVEAEKTQLQNELIQAQKMESIGRLAGGIAHDFNNLLTAIMGNTEISLRNISPESPLYSQMKTVMNAAESAADLTRQLLSFSRKQIIDPKPVNLNEIIENMHMMLVRVIGENITLRPVLEKNLKAARVDISQIQQIIMNLAVNSRDAMPDGGTLSIETANTVLDDSYCQRHTYPIKGGHVMLAVSDTGTGMSK
ncbi:MAG: PAS domain-containing sensor histidine kinase, partial [Spirochaetota bacterium]